MAFVCTLFEGRYHYGVAGLLNSLSKSKFRGSVYAGYKGVLPFWAKNLIPVSILNGRAELMSVSNELQIIFIPLLTDFHLTNYKPIFMLDLLNTAEDNINSLFYFDPDIIVKAPFSFLENWITYGVTVCEDVNSPLSGFHPRRMAWRDYFARKNIDLSFKGSLYANGGYVGLGKKDQAFLEVWKKIQHEMAPEIGGLNRSSLTGTPLLDCAKSPFFHFSKTDQDALNAAIEAWNGTVSFIGKEGMGFKPGAAVMLHSLGTPKPWDANYLLRWIKGYPPKPVDKDYWKCANCTIKTYSGFYIFYKRLTLIVASFLARCYRRN